MAEIPLEVRLIKKQTLVRFWPFASFIVSVYILVSVFILHDYFTAYIHSFNLLLLLVMMPICIRHNKILLASNTLAAVGMLTIFPWLFTGGLEGTGFWLSITYVVGAFLVTTKRSAIFWISFYLLSSMLIASLAFLGFFKIAYTPMQLANLWFIYVITFVFVYLFNEVREHYVQLSYKELNEKLKAEEKFKILLESTPDALVVVDKDSRIVLVNQETEKLFHYKREEIIGRHIDELLPENGTPPSEQVSRFKLSSPKEQFALTKNKELFPVEVSVSPLESEELIIRNIRDITRNKEEEERLRKYSILEAKSKEMEQFTYIASHDLRHPLLTIINFIKIFEEDYGSQINDGARKYLSTISESADRMDKLIIGLLDYSRLSQIKTLEEVDCHKIMQEVLTDMNATIKLSGAKITIADLPKITAYNLEIRQLFQNLLANAIKFRKKDILLEIEISVLTEQGFHRFEIRDNGIGIEEKNKARIFQIFQRLHPAETYEGVGLGLAYCKKIVEMHNGNIWVESKLNEGSTFIFTINS